MLKFPVVRYKSGTPSVPQFLVFRLAYRDMNSTLAKITIPLDVATFQEKLVLKPPPHLMIPPHDLKDMATELEAAHEDEKFRYMDYQDTKEESVAKDIVRDPFACFLDSH